MMAPYERGLDHGGSQRATAMAERLEERGAEVAWWEIPSHSTSRLAKLRDAAVLEPALAGIYDRAGAPPAGPFDVVVSAHSFLARHLASFPPEVVRVIDFHNLEWRQLDDNASFEPLRRQPHPRLQVRLMRRFERRVTARCDLASFASEEELRWATAAAPGSDLALVPSVLPRDAERRALAVGERTEARDDAHLAYIGTVKFPPNLRALIRFLRETWPPVRAAVPGARLTIAGKCSDADRRRLGDFPGVEALGFVEDVETLLARCSAVIMPIEGRAGTALRPLLYALAGVWVIGTPAAFRGLPWEMGVVVESPDQWAAAVKQGSKGQGDRIAAARAAALELQRDDRPWDDLWARIGALAERRHQHTVATTATT